ncbi:hypothetical protein ZHAS_00009993 [Anopheles sinensis]|uniref:Uncharacterized protein n=1 Tax=Anopheles sinensis TaxID=74873 RepID=A0A084VWG4_ANOSI|nr:hypothetical protein ZHAS_00009993 [Anopheles sinensis]
MATTRTAGVTNTATPSSDTLRHVCLLSNPITNGLSTSDRLLISQDGNVQNLRRNSDEVSILVLAMSVCLGGVGDFLHSLLCRLDRVLTQCRQGTEPFRCVSNQYFNGFSVWSPIVSSVKD